MENETNRVVTGSGRSREKGVKADFQVHGQQVDGEIEISEREDGGFHVGFVGSQASFSIALQVPPPQGGKIY